MDPHRAYLPSPGNGPVGEAHFLRDPNRYLDERPERLAGLLGICGGSLGGADEEVRILENILPQWSWITTHCAGLVYRIHGGWLFSTAADVVLYRMEMSGRDTQKAAA